MKSGDIGRMDEDGYVYILDRKKDVINSGGFNVYAAEVEAVIASHPAVLCRWSSGRRTPTGVRRSLPRSS